MPTSLCTARHIVEVVNQTDVEWDVMTAFNKRESVCDFRKMENLTFV
jgi:hypothetical protein